MRTTGTASSSRVAVVVMAKKPAPGRTKTRLLTALSPEEAAGLYAAMLADRCAQVAGLRDVIPAIAIAGFDDDVVPPGLVPDELELIPSTGNGLGADLLAAAIHFLASDVPVILVDSDSPTLPTAYLREAVEVLRGDRATSSCDMVLGASRDGGYYLIGLRRPAPDLFREIPWSTPEVAAATLARAADLDLAIHRLPDWWDVDTPEDLEHLRNTVEQTSSPTRTADWLRAARLRGVQR